MTFKNILLGSWELIQDVKYKLFQLQVPKDWQQVAQFLANARFKIGRSKYPSVPVHSLDSIIAASFPNIIQTMRYGWQRPGQPWILATETADLSYLPDLIKDWLREEFSECLGDDEVESKLNTLDNEAWHWENEPTNYSIWHQPENRNVLDVRFQALPDYLTEEFLKNPTVLFDGDIQYQLTFYPVVRLGKGSEIMSWPPQRVPLIEYKHQEKRTEEVGEAYISFVISFKLQTVPWRNQPIIYHQLSTRQWMTKPLDKFPYRGATVFIGDRHRWLDGVDQPFCFIPLPIKQKITPEGRQPKWSRAISELLLLNDSPLPEPNTLAVNPMYQWSALNEVSKGIQAAISYDTRHPGDRPCFPGVSPRDLASLDRAIQNKIEQEGFPLRRVGNAVKISGNYIPFWKKGEPKKKGDKSPKKRDDLSTPMLRPSLAASSVFRTIENSPHTILILWETKECRDRLIAEICELLKLLPKGETQIYQTLPEVQGEETLYESPLGTLRIKTQHVQDLTQKLDVENPSVKGKTRQQRRINLLDERIRQITLSLPKTDGKLSGALIEIRSKKSFFPPESDPKLALRIGAMQAGYVNQHIHPLTAQNKKGEEYKTKDAPNRVQKAVSDLLRQFGILPAPLIDPQKDAIDSNLWLTCFYVLRRTRKTTASNMPSTVALMVRVNPVAGIVQVTTPSLFPTWVSYPVGLGYLIAEKWDSDSYVDETTGDSSEEESYSDKKQEQQLLNKFVTNCLRDCLNTSIEAGKPSRVLFMAEAQNARQMLSWLQNPKLPANDLPDELKRDMTESEQKRLLMVRLRVATNGEVPVGIVKGSPGSRISAGGVFCWSDAWDSEKAVLYLSIRKPLNTEPGKNTLQKHQFRSRLDNGSRQAANPKLLEIAVVHSPAIAPDKLACFVHNLRNRWPYFADDLSLPFPFPFATLAYEYAVSAKDAVELNDSDDSEECLD